MVKVLCTRAMEELNMYLCVKDLCRLKPTQGFESSDFINLISDFFALHKAPFQTFTALKSTSFQAFQIISIFFRLFLTDAHTLVYIFVLYLIFLTCFRYATRPHNAVCSVPR